MDDPNKKAHIQHDHSQPHVPSVDGGPDLLSGSSDITDRLLLYRDHALLTNAVGVSSERGAERKKRQEEQPPGRRADLCDRRIGHIDRLFFDILHRLFDRPDDSNGRFRHLFGLRPRHAELIHHDIDGRVAIEGRELLL